ncbi:Uncharacterised protein [Mycolicibacterium vanbaalenii]|uniref:Uncharacterized protein n=1 Tax=Mycolicibacterium vanbaalenii TaxID=110539 RepID=A0A5S9R3N2_MYCVN|nr:hypothetical protein [Mycolicibacterium vanbaalenii]CAA0127329.1 Uncharacterised protein [Mycolicibacterium vanbaalenii]
MEVLPTRGDDALQTYRSVVWCIEVRDPAKILVDDSVGERTQGTVSAVAASYGCIFDCCYDDDEVDEIPYYQWMIRVPQAEHRRRTTEDIPRVIDAVRSALQSALPAPFDDWLCYPHAEISYSNAVSDYLRNAYADLLDVFDARFLPRRRDGAEALEPTATYYGDRLSDGSLVATYNLWLCEEPGGHRWSVLNVGLVPDVLPGVPVGRTRVAVDQPVLLAPRPTMHCTWTWMASLRVGGFNDHVGNPGVISTQPADGARYQWQAADPTRLADMIERDLRLLFPMMW